MRKVIGSSGLVFAVGVSAASLSCAISAEEAEIQQALEASSLVETIQGKNFTDRRGRRWKHVRKVEFASESDEDVRPAPRRELKSEQELTLDELADRLRATTLINGHEYELADLPLDLARKVRAAEKVAEGKPWEPPPPILTRTNPFDAEPEHLTPMGHIFGSDNRQRHRNNTVYPFRAMVWITNSAQTGACTGTLIGSSTMVSAAHCFHNGSDWLSTRRYGPGVDSQDPNRFSFSLSSSTYPDPNAGPLNCGQVWIPTQWAQGNTDVEFDFAIVSFIQGDTRCPGWNAYLGWTLGWLGTLKPSNGNLNGQAIYGYGYPKGTDYQCPGGTCNFPQIWGMGQSGSLDYSGCCQIEYEADMGDGQSGQAMYFLWGSDRYVIGTHKGTDWSVFDGYYNRGRRFTEASYSFFEDYTGWFRDSDLYKSPYAGDLP